MGTKSATVGQSKNVLFSGERAESRKICGLLNDGCCQQIAEHLLIKRAATEQNNNPVLAHIVATAYQICLTCSQYRAEFELHQQACEDVVKRQREMQQRLAAMLELASRHGEPTIPEKAAVGCPTPAADFHLPPSREEGLSGLWQRVQNWLGRESHPKSVASAPDSKTEITSASRLGKGTAVAPTIPETREHTSLAENSAPQLTVYCLGTFRVYLNETPVDNWNGNKGKAIFKYMVVHRERPIPIELLMDTFWRDDEPEAARRNLYQAIYLLRQALQIGNPDFSHILSSNGFYELNPELNIWLDSEAFYQHYENAIRICQVNHFAKAVIEFEAAESLYGDDFLVEDAYEDWPIARRESLKNAHLDLLSRLAQYYYDQKNWPMCITYNQKLVREDSCHEDAHRNLMQAYLNQGQRHLALRQYYCCVEALQKELDVTPMPETIELYQHIQNA